jgi:hypothetical protein
LDDFSGKEVKNNQKESSNSRVADLENELAAIKTQYEESQR